MQKVEVKIETSDNSENENVNLKEACLETQESMEPELDTLNSPQQSAGNSKYSGMLKKLLGLVRPSLITGA